MAAHVTGVEPVDRGRSRRAGGGSTPCHRANRWRVKTRKGRGSQLPSSPCPHAPGSCGQGAGRRGGAAGESARGRGAARTRVLPPFASVDPVTLDGPHASNTRPPSGGRQCRGTDCRAQCGARRHRAARRRRWRARSGLGGGRHDRRRRAPLAVVDNLSARRRRALVLDDPLTRTPVGRGGSVAVTTSCDQMACRRSLPWFRRS
jgi:hypothetical protein